MQRTGLARSTILQYLAEHIRSDKPATIDAWVKPELYQRIAAVVQRTGGERLKPFFIALGEKVPYDDIRLVVAHLRRDG
jgi:ATP-dependent DNA helicase RecQ